MVDFDFFLRQKYAQLQQQADATTQNAKTNSVVGQAAARLDNTRSALLPAESRAGVAKTVAETGLIGEQAKVVAPTAAANIANTNANTKATLTGEEVTRRQGLTSLGALIGPDALRQLTGILSPAPAAGGGAVFRTSDITPAFPGRRAPLGGSVRGSGPNGAMTAEELDRYNGL